MGNDLLCFDDDEEYVPGNITKYMLSIFKND